MSSKTRCCGFSYCGPVEHLFSKIAAVTKVAYAHKRRIGVPNTKITVNLFPT
jgi:hypothetical protein